MSLPFALLFALFYGFYLRFANICAFYAVIFVIFGEIGEDFYKISPRFLQDFPKILTRFPQDFPKISETEFAIRGSFLPLLGEVSYLFRGEYDLGEVSYLFRGGL